jgi:hypothetical protein
MATAQMLYSDLTLRTSHHLLTRILPNVDEAILSKTIDLSQLGICELEVSESIEGVIQLIYIPCAN